MGNFSFNDPILFVGQCLARCTAATLSGESCHFGTNFTLSHLNQF